MILRQNVRITIMINNWWKKGKLKRMEIQLVTFFFKWFSIMGKPQYHQPRFIFISFEIYKIMLKIYVGFVPLRCELGQYEGAATGLFVAELYETTNKSPGLPIFRRWCSVWGFLHCLKFVTVKFSGKIYENVEKGYLGLIFDFFGNTFFIIFNGYFNQQITTKNRKCYKIVEISLV